MRRRSLFTDAAIAAALALLVVSALSIAHAPSNWYTLRWKVDERDQNYGFGGGVPTGNFRDRVENGAQHWNELGGDMQFRRGGVNVTWGWDFSCANRAKGDNSIHFGGIDGGPQPGEFNTYARTKHCVYSDQRDRIWSTAIQFDQAEDWYNGTDNTPSGRVDTFAVATHEFGHAGGFQGHFPGGTDICTQPNKQTMCQGLPLGESFWRSLEEHDRHTFNEAY